MSDWRSAGHAIRRRMGAPTAHSQSTGIGARVNLPTPEEALSGMARVGSPRVPMGTSAIPSPKVAVPVKGTLIPKKSGKSQDPTLGPTNHRPNVGYSEKMGAAYRVSVSTPR
jgi:hypothetical protein